MQLVTTHVPKSQILVTKLPNKRQKISIIMAFSIVKRLYDVTQETRHNWCVIFGTLQHIDRRYILAISDF